MIDNENMEGDTLDRRVKIINLLESKGQVKISQLSNQFKVSEVTIRNDLKHLQDKGLIFRTRGGGISTHNLNLDIKISQKVKINSKEKQLIGQKAASLIKENETIMLDSGTTTIEIAKNLNSFKSITVVSNALDIVNQLIDKSNVQIIMLGGFYRAPSNSLIGPIAEANTSNIFCDKLFLGVDSISSEFGVSTPLIEEAQLNRLMINISKEVIVVTDSSKFNRRGFALIAPISKINTLITDSGIPEVEKENLEKAGVKIIVV